MKALLAAVACGTCLAVSARTFHRSFAHREVGYGFGTGSAGVSFPVDRRIAVQVDNARMELARKEAAERAARKRSARAKRDARVLVAVPDATNRVDSARSPRRAISRPNLPQRD